MKTKTAGHSMGPRIVGFALGGLLLSGALAGDFGAASKSIAKRLQNSFTARTQKSCQPLAPIETSLTFASTPRIGQPVQVNFDVLSLEKGVNAEVRFDNVPGVQIAGRLVETGDFSANQAYRFSRTYVFSQPGRYEIAAQAIAGIPEYRFGRRNHLYVDVTGSGIRYSDKPFDQPDVTPFGGAQRAQTLQPPPLFMQNTLPLPTAEFPKTDPNGKPLDGGEGTGGPDVPTTVYGYWRYMHTDGTFHWGYGAQAQAWDQDDFSADDFLGSVIVNSVGYYEITFDNNSDGGLEPGTADVYISWITDNSEVQVHNASDTVYRNSTGVIFPNITGGSHNAGTYNPLGSGIRANQLEDELTRGWSAGVTFGHNAHKTYCEWYPGSTDGAYYRRSENRIYINDDHVSSIDVILHEYGHSFHDSFNGEDDWPPGAGGNHSLTGHYTDGLALTEGYATYFSCAAQGDDRWYDDLDPGNLIHFDCDANWDGNGAANGNSDNLSNNPNWGYDTESAVLSFLLDIDDTRNSTTDPYDWSSLNYQEIHEVFMDYMVSGHHLYSIRDFYAGWYAQNHPERPKINGQMMVHGMKQGIDRGALGVSGGISSYSGTWYFGGYGRANFTVKNYGSQNYQLNQLYIWATDPDGTDIPGFGGDGNNALIASGASREILKSWDQVGLNGVGTIVADPRYGAYRFRAGHYRSDGAWQLLEPAESGTDRDITKNVVEDTTAPTATSQDDGNFQFSRTSIHLTATAVELQSSIRSFWVRLGSSPGGSDIMAFTEYPQNNDPTFDRTINFPQVPYGTTIYADVVARNIEGLDGWSSTNGIQVVNPEIMPTSFTPTRGNVIAGNNVSFLQNSDDQRMQIRPGATLSSAQDPIELVVAATVPVMNLNSINLKVESSATSTNVRLKIDMYDYDANVWVNVRDVASTTSDTVYLHLRNDPSRWISAGGTVRARIRYKQTGPVLSYPFTTRLDWVHWTLN